MAQRTDSDVLRPYSLRSDISAECITQINMEIGALNCWCCHHNVRGVAWGWAGSGKDIAAPGNKAGPSCFAGENI